VNLWLLGHPDRALAQARDAVARARALGHPFTLAFTLFFETLVHWFRGDMTSQRELADQTIALSETHGFLLWLGGALAFRAAALVASEAGTKTSEVTAGLSLAATTGSQLAAPLTIALLAEVHRTAGEIGEADGAVEAALAVSGHTGQRLWDAELHRLKGEMLLEREAETDEKAERSLQRALEIARAQGTRSLELRAATSLARLWRDQRQRAEARGLLGPVYATFTEGFDTRDLIDAKALLDELAGPGPSEMGASPHSPVGRSPRRAVRPSTRLRRRRG
jgi:predicted ATPase